MESLSVFIKRFLAFLAGPVVAAGISFVIVPLTTWLVAPSEFGKASMYTLVISLSSLIVYLGLDQAFVREYHESGDKKNLFMNAVSLPLILALCISFFAFSFWRFFSKTLFGEIAFVPVLCFCLAFPFTVLERFTLLTIRMEEKGRLYSSMVVIRQLIRAPLLFFWISRWRTFEGILLAEATAQILFSVFSSLVAKKYWACPMLIDLNLIKKLMRFGIPLLPATVLMWFFNGMATMSLRYWSTFEELGLYAAAFKIVGVLLIFNNAFSLFWAPTAYRWYTEKVGVEKFQQVGNSLSALMTFVGFLVIGLRKYIILIMSPAYGNAVSIMPFLVFIPVMYAVSEVTVVGTNFMKRTEFHIVTTAVSVVSNLTGNSLLVPILGAQGAAISAGISYVFFFWCRTFFSLLLWQRFDVSTYFFNMLFLVFFASSTYLDSWESAVQILIIFCWFYYNKNMFIPFLYKK